MLSTSRRGSSRRQRRAEILIGADTLSLVRDAVTVQPVEPLELKGKREPVPAFRLVAVDLTADAFARHLDAPLVGRVREAAAAPGATSRLSCRSAPVTCSRCSGPPASASHGSSRSSWRARARSADVLHARCLHYGDDITYWPLVEILLAIDVEPDAVIGSSPGRDAARVPQAARGPRGRAAADRRTRRHPVGRARLPRSDRAHRRLVARRADLPALRRPTRSARGAARLGRRQAERDHDPPRAALRGGLRGAPRRPGGRPRRSAGRP